jgi:hypothetical protein
MRMLRLWQGCKGDFGARSPEWHGQSDICRPTITMKPLLGGIRQVRAACIVFAPKAFRSLATYGDRTNCGPKQAWLDPAGSVPVYWDSFHIAGYQPHGMDASGMRTERPVAESPRLGSIPSPPVLHRRCSTASAPPKLGSVHHSYRVCCGRLPVTSGIVWVLGGCEV